MSNDNWGPWIAHKGTEMPATLNGDDQVQTWRIDFSGEYLPNGLGQIHEDVTGDKTLDADDIPWHNPPFNKMVVAYRVKKDPVVEERTVWMRALTGVIMEDVPCQCTYTDGKLTKIRWDHTDA